MYYSINSYDMYTDELIHATKVVASNPYSALHNFLKRFPEFNHARNVVREYHIYKVKCYNPATFAFRAPSSAGAEWEMREVPEEFVEVGCCAMCPDEAITQAKMMAPTWEAYRIVEVDIGE